MTRFEKQKDGSDKRVNWIFCERCKNLVGGGGFPDICKSKENQKLVKTWLRESMLYGDPKEINKDNNCKHYNPYNCYKENLRRLNEN